jgi:hypothetical protein
MTDALQPDASARVYVYDDADECSLADYVEHPMRAARGVQTALAQLL